MLTQEELKMVLDYDIETGFFKWKISGGRIKSGDIAGTTRNDGYVTIQLNKKRYLSHRLAWLYVSGYLPENNIDHIDRNPGNNSIKNLREVSQQCNLRNTKQRTDNTSGIKGVYFNKEHGIWSAMITNNIKLNFLGYHEDFEEAVCHRLAAEQCLGWHGCDSHSPAFEYVNR